jgi:hypothetical protein
MTAGILATLRATDIEHAKGHLHLRQRPFHATVDILGDPASMGVSAKPEVQKILAACAEMISKLSSMWPGMGVPATVLKYDLASMLSAESLEA